MIQTSSLMVENFDKRALSARVHHVIKYVNEDYVFPSSMLLSNSPIWSFHLSDLGELSFKHEYN